MDILYETFDRAGELYNQWFGNWLHIHSVVRIILLILGALLVVFVAAQIIKLIIVPILLMFYYHVIFRIWNYFMVETPQELMYIRNHSNDSLQHNKRYLKLCDKVKRNRTKLEHTKYRGMIYRARRYAAGFMAVFGFIAIVWVVSFGLYRQEVLPAMVTNVAETPPVTEPEAEPQTQPQETEYEQAEAAPHWLGTREWNPDESLVLYLNETGQQGTRLRSGPGIANYSVIELLWDNDRLVYLHSYYPDEETPGLYWLRVLSPSGTEGYVSSKDIGVE